MNELSISRKNRDFYQSLRRRVRDYVRTKGPSTQRAEVLLVAPDLFHLMCRLALDERIDAKSKATLGVAIAYFISPLDIMPEALVGPVGFLDDALLAAYAIDKVINHGHEDVAREHWAGDEDLLPLIQRLTAMAARVIGHGKWNKVKKVFGGRQ